MTDMPSKFHLLVNLLCCGQLLRVNRSDPWMLGDIRQQGVIMESVLIPKPETTEYMR